MADLVTLDDYKGALKVTGTDEDAVLETYLNAAEALCLDYVDQRLGDTAEEWSETIATWIAGTVDTPLQVTAAILELAVMLYRFRGDDEEPPKAWADGRMPPSVRMKLDRFRDPAIA